MVRLHPELPNDQSMTHIFTYPALSFIYVFGHQNYSSLPTGEFSTFFTRPADFGNNSDQHYMSPNGRRFIWPLFRDVWQLELATKEETLLFDRNTVPGSFDTKFFVSEQENRIVFLNHDHIYARALEDIPSATQPMWAEYK